jgi:hypothetical protein
MGLKTVERIPPDAVHAPDNDTTLPNGTKIEQFFVIEAGRGDLLYERVTLPDGHTNLYLLTPDVS